MDFIFGKCRLKRDLRYRLRNPSTDHVIMIG